MLGSIVLEKISYWIVSICCLILTPGFFHIEPLVSHIKPLPKWVGRYERNSPVMGSTSSSHNSADYTDVLRGQKETPARNRSCHLFQVNCVSIVVLQFIFSIMHGVSHCQVSST